MTLLAVTTPVRDYRVGDMRPWLASFVVTATETVVKANWLACNGALVLISKYPTLFVECGFAYSPTPGTNPGGGQFYLPNYTDGRIFIPRGSTRYPTRGLTGGEQTHALASNGSEDAPHTHGINNQNATFGGSGQYGPVTKPGSTAYSGPSMFGYASFGAGSNNGNTGGHLARATGAINSRAGGNPTAHQNMPPVRVIGGMIICFQ